MPKANYPLKITAWERFCGWCLALVVLFMFIALVVPKNSEPSHDFAYVGEPARKAQGFITPIQSGELGLASTDYAPTSYPYVAPVGGCAENGSCYGDYSYNTGRPKTVHVEGYARSDGTYVRGHYRSAPR